MPHEQVVGVVAEVETGQLDVAVGGIVEFNPSVEIESRTDEVVDVAHHDFVHDKPVGLRRKSAGRKQYEQECREQTKHGELFFVDFYVGKGTIK